MVDKRSAPFVNPLPPIQITYKAGQVKQWLIGTIWALIIILDGNTRLP
jgi:hypothetical protein